EVTANNPQNILTTLTSSVGTAILHDATTREDFRQGLLALIERNTTLGLSAIGGDAGLLPAASAQNAVSASQPIAPAPLTAQPGQTAAPPRSGAPTVLLAGLQRLQPRESPSAGDPTPLGGRLDARASIAFTGGHISHRLSSRIGSAEQSNTSIIYGKELILKLFRRLEPGENPDVEIGRFLTEIAHFPRIAPFLGEVSITPAGGEKTTVAMLQGLVANQGDGWQWFLEQLAGFFTSIATVPPPPEAPAPSFLNEPQAPSKAMESAGLSLEVAALLGRRTAEMHLALRSEE